MLRFRSLEEKIKYEKKRARQRKLEQRYYEKRIIVRAKIRIIRLAKETKKCQKKIRKEPPNV